MFGIIAAGQALWAAGPGLVASGVMRLHPVMLEASSFWSTVLFLFVLSVVLAMIGSIYESIKAKNYGRVPTMILMALAVLFFPFVLIGMICLGALKK